MTVIELVFMQVLMFICCIFTVKGTKYMDYYVTIQENFNSWFSPDLLEMITAFCLLLLLNIGVLLLLQIMFMIKNYINKVS